MRDIRQHVKIRLLQKDDIENILELLKKTGLLFESCDTRETYERMIEHNPQSVLVMTRNELIIGMMFIVYSPLVAILYHGCIDPEFQGQGLGTVLMIESEKVIKELGGTKCITAYIEEGNNPSLSMCERLGFETHSVPIVCVYKDCGLK